MIRATAAPDRFLTRGYARFISRSQAVSPRAPARASFELELPRDLGQLLLLTGGRTLGDFVPKRGARSPAGGAFTALLTAARRTALAHARLVALLAGTVPFGATRGGELWLYVLGEPTSPARGVIATLDPAVPSTPRLAFRDASSFAFACALDASAAAGEDASRVTELRTRLAIPGVAEQEGVRASFERAMALLDLLGAGDASVRRAAKKLALRPFEPPHPPRARAKELKQARTTPLAFGALVEAFFRKETEEALAIVVPQRASGDRLVRDAAVVLEDALATTKAPRTALGRDLARRRKLALRAARAESKDGAS